MPFSATLEEPSLPSPLENDKVFSHNAGLLSIAGKKGSPSTLNTRGAIDADRREQLPPAVEDRGEELSAGKYGGIPWAMAAMLATREDIEATLNDQRLPYKPPDLPQCFARDLRVPRNHTEAMRSEHAHLWKDSSGREFYGLLEAGTFEPV